MWVRAIVSGNVGDDRVVVKTIHMEHLPPIGWGVLVENNVEVYGKKVNIVTTVRGGVYDPYTETAELHLSGHDLLIGHIDALLGQLGWEEMPVPTEEQEGSKT